MENVDQVFQLDSKEFEQAANLPVQTAIDITKKLYAIKNIEKRCEYIQLQMEESEQYYGKKLEQLQTQIEFIKGSIRAGLDYLNLRNLPTPAGTVFIRNSTKTEWPDEAILGAWAQVELPEMVTEVKSLKFNKQELLQKIKETGKTPPGFNQFPVSSLEIREA